MLVGGAEGQLTPPHIFLVRAAWLAGGAGGPVPAGPGTQRAAAVCWACRLPEDLFLFVQKQGEPRVPARQPPPPLFCLLLLALRLRYGSRLLLLKFLLFWPVLPCCKPQGQPCR